MPDFFDPKNAYRLPPPSGPILRLHPMLAGGLAHQGIDPEDFRRRVNAQFSERDALDGTVGDAIDADFIVASTEADPTT